MDFSYSKYLIYSKKYQCIRWENFCKCNECQTPRYLDFIAKDKVKGREQKKTMKWKRGGEQHRAFVGHMKLRMSPERNKRGFTNITIPLILKKNEHQSPDT